MARNSHFSDYKIGFKEPRETGYFYVHNFGKKRQDIFASRESFDRFEAYLYLLNAVESQRAANFFPNRTHEIFSSARGERLVAIAAYVITPKDFQLLVTPQINGGISKFMQKLQTAYTMYFNSNNNSFGNVFQNTYMSEHIESDERLKHFFASIHLHPFESSLKGAFDIKKLANLARQYRYSSINEYATSKFVIADPSSFPRYFRIGQPDRMLGSWFNPSVGALL